MYLEHGLVVRDTDALSVSGNFLAECGSRVELTGSGQASKVTNNLSGGGYVGFSSFAEGHMGMRVSGNKVFPRGKGSVQFKNCARSAITANRLHAFYPGMVNYEGSCAENLVGANHFLRQMEPFDPLKPYNNGLDDLFGLVHVAGNSSSRPTAVRTPSDPLLDVTLCSSQAPAHTRPAEAVAPER